MNTERKPVDVLAVLEAMRRREDLPLAVEIEAVEAVFELVMADLEYDQAGRYCALAKSDEEMQQAGERYCISVDRRRAALARIGGAA